MIYVIVENLQGSIRKASIEAVSYAVALSEKLQKPLQGIALGPFKEGELQKLSQYGLEQLIHVTNEAYKDFSSINYTNAVAQVVKDPTVIVLPQGYDGRALAPRLSIRLQMPLLSGIHTLLEPYEQGYKAQRIAYSNKGIETVYTPSQKVIVTLKANSFVPQKKEASLNITTTEVAAATDKERVVGREQFSGKVPLTEANVVVSGGRGLKGPENWGMIEELAQLLGAATACSKPVADEGWRPHHEHVGQTGIQIAPNVYIAIGISGAIQHLAGVSASKNIIVINKDKDAPFFKNCDYGVVGDAFEVVPKLIEAIKRYKGLA